jgi:uncharacterized PurR-regulated membrane protein YhhQ (DUF165 family)
VSLRRLTASAAVCAALVAATAVLFQMPLERAAVLAPVIVAAAGALAFLVVLWTRVAVVALQGTRHPRRIVVAGLAALALLVVLSFFVELPSRR